MSDDNRPQNEEKEWDHKVLGRSMDLFAFSDVVGKGLPLWLPKGASIRRELERFIVDEEVKHNYLHVYTPDIAKLDLYKKSGHYPYYKDSMYAPIEIEDEQYMLRPMTCPHHFELYLTRPRSYKELPMRIAEIAKLYRFEKSGELAGLSRVRSFCLSDAHIVCTKEQAATEIENVIDLIEELTGKLGLKVDEDYSYRLSLGDRKDEKKYFKDDSAWDHAEDLLREVLKKRNSKFVESENEAAFYGPKIDVQMKNANGKEETAFTVQYDFVMPKRFELTYTDKDGKQAEPVVVHRSAVGAIERVVAYLIEHYKGVFPLWLSPVQVSILPITERNVEYGERIKKELMNHRIRVELDDRNETLHAKIRDAQIQKVPYMVVIGDKEESAKKLSIRDRSGSTSEFDIEDFLVRLKEEIDERSNL